MIINKRVRYRCIFFLFSGDEKKKKRKGKEKACLFKIILILYFSIA